MNICFSNFKFIFPTAPFQLFYSVSHSTILKRYLKWQFNRRVWASEHCTHVSWNDNIRPIWTEIVHTQTLTMIALLEPGSQQLLDKIHRYFRDVKMWGEKFLELMECNFKYNYKNYNYSHFLLRGNLYVVWVGDKKVTEKGKALAFYLGVDILDQKQISYK